MPYTKIRYHFVFATKRRRRLITPRVEEVLYPAIRRAVYELKGHPIAINGIEDHVHLFCATRPSIAPSDFIGRVKSYSSRIVSLRFPTLNFRWQVGFGLFTVNPYDHDRLVAYVRNQKIHHARKTTLPRYERS